MPSTLNTNQGANQGVEVRHAVQSSPLCISSGVLPLPFFENRSEMSRREYQARRPHQRVERRDDSLHLCSVRGVKVELVKIAFEVYLCHYLRGATHDNEHVDNVLHFLRPTVVALEAVSLEGNEIVVAK